MTKITSICPIIHIKLCSLTDDTYDIKRLAADPSFIDIKINNILT